MTENISKKKFLLHISTSIRLLVQGNPTTFNRLIREEKQNLHIVYNETPLVSILSYYYHMSFNNQYEREHNLHNVKNEAMDHYEAIMTIEHEFFQKGIEWCSTCKFKHNYNNGSGQASFCYPLS